MKIWTASVDHLPHVAYEVLGLLVEHEMAGLSLARDLVAKIRDVLGGRTRAYDAPITQSLVQCLERLETRVQAAGGHALIGVRVAMTPVTFKSMTLLQVCVYGTAIRILPGLKPATAHPPATASDAQMRVCHDEDGSSSLDS